MAQKKKKEVVVAPIPNVNLESSITGEGLNKELDVVRFDVSIYNQVGKSESIKNVYCYLEGNCLVINKDNTQTVIPFSAVSKIEIKKV